MDKLIIATRGSKLALWQSKHIKARLQELRPGLEVELNIIVTSGDKIQDVALAKIGGKGLFLKELEEAMLRGEAHMAVHSLKDVPTVMPEGLPLAAITEREDVREAMSYMKKYPKTFAVYYYHFPLRSLHPAAVPLVKAAYVAEQQGHKDVVEGLYKVKVDGREPNIQKIIDAFNKTQNTKITLKDIANPAVSKHVDSDVAVAQEHLVNGTPTVFFDGEKDVSKLKYKNVKIIK